MKVPTDEIIKYFDDLPIKILTTKHLSDILSKQRHFWRLSEHLYTAKFIDYLLKNAKLARISFKFPFRNIIRYTWGEIPLFEIIISLMPNAYLTHYTAMFLHELTEQIPKTIYLNFEQPRKTHRTGTMEQASIDTAFKRQVRVSQNIATYNDYSICLLNGMYTGQLGVIDIEGPNKANIRATDIERTLIDIAVRPIYSGGIFEVLKAYKLAREKVSINKLAATLKKLDYQYPYHQVIGFYLDKAGCYMDSSIEIFQKFPRNYDFYLTHGIEKLEYSQKWRLFFPKGF
jgi:predicted transcriptional regulator of viral defense system